MIKKTCLILKQYGVLIMALFVCSTAFAFNKICIKVIPGAWFAADMRLVINIPDTKIPIYSDLVGPVSVNYQACFSTKGYFFAGAKVKAEVFALWGTHIYCTPFIILEDPSFGTYTYNTWGTTFKPVCRKAENA